MKTFLRLPLLSLLMLAALSVSDGNEALAQGKGKEKHQKEYKNKKGGPPAWAPAHGHRRKMEATQDYDDRKWRSKEEELRQRERELARREEAMKRKERSRSGNGWEGTGWDGKKRSEEAQKKRESQQDSPQRSEDIIKQREEEKRRQKAEEIRKRLPGF